MKRFTSRGAIIIFVLGLVFSNASSISADTTSTLLPNGQGNYTSWNGDENDLDESGTPSCGSNDYIDSNNSNNRESVNLDLSSIPNGNTITSVEVFTWDVAQFFFNVGGTYQTFVRVGTTDTNSGVNLNTTSSNGCTQRSQVINIVDFVKSGTTDLEVGGMKVGNTTVRVGAIRAIVTHTPPDTIAPVLAQVTAVPTVTNDVTPSYTFSSTEAGTITYGGDCSSVTTAAVAGNNTITFNTLAPGLH